jgi:glyoxylase-like metal-dependent hydrolase (beta-lactamase superfamily II)
VNPASFYQSGVYDGGVLPSADGRLELVLGSSFMETANKQATAKPSDSIHRITVGDLVVAALSDGVMKGGDRVVRGIDQSLVESTLRAANRFPANVEVNVFLIEHAERKILIDTGSGHYMGRSAGRLDEHLRTSGIRPEQIDAVLLTHIHPDHVGGLTTRDGVARFPNAELLVNSEEYAFWMEGHAEAWVQSDQRALFVDCPREQIAPYMDRLRLITDGEAVFPSVTAMRSPGHTPGHSVFVVGSGQDKLLIWADTVHVPEVQTAFPEAGVIFDVDAAQAAASRRRVFELVLSERLPVLGMHTEHGSLINLERDGTGFKIVHQAL